ncbi:hypothetical protein [Streptomyces durbertensis]|uniref:hypothetical protein n=1 Tax=Streptomyces durbertensis TaxID=2448886 RepID=UPI002B2196FF|nr:hypothetical protein [Streptomyces durbertensis]
MRAHVGPGCFSAYVAEALEHRVAMEIRFHLGNAPVQLPEPVAQLARTVVHVNRKGHVTMGALASAPWLVPGGQPGRPAAPQS